MIKPPVRLIFEAYKNSGKAGFCDWLEQNEKFLKEFEKQLVIDAVDSARGGEGESYWEYYVKPDAIDDNGQNIWIMGVLKKVKNQLL
jgi:hypothetical protein